MNIQRRMTNDKQLLHILTYLISLKWDVKRQIIISKPINNAIINLWQNKSLIFHVFFFIGRIAYWSYRTRKIHFRWRKNISISSMSYHLIDISSQRIMNTSYYYLKVNIEIIWSICLAVTLDAWNHSSSA